MEFLFLNGGKKMSKISVVMPVYNTKKEFLCEAMESILNQTFSDFEFLIIDDGSTNPCVKETISTYHDPRIKYFYKDNSGVADTLNFGLSKATGEYIARMDSDDISVPERFEKQVVFLDSHPGVSLVGGWIEFFPKGNIWKTPQRPAYLDFLNGPKVAHPSVMFRRQDFEKYDLKYNPEYPAEDYDLWSRAIRVLKIENIQEVLLKYRVSDEQVTTAKTSRITNSAQRTQRNMLDFLTRDHIKQQALLNLINPPVSKLKILGLPFLKIKKTPFKSKYLLFNYIPIAILKKSVASLKPILLDDTQLLSELKKLGKFSYMPNSGNMGDMLIASATMKWFDENDLKWDRTKPKEFPENFVYGGGGAWLHEWIGYMEPIMDKMRKAKKVVILPSSFDNVPELVQILDERFVVFCREKKSYDYLLSQKTKATILLDHDMAFRGNMKVRKKLKSPSGKWKKLYRNLMKELVQFGKEVRFFRKDSESFGHYDTDLDLSEYFGHFTNYEPRKVIDFAANTMLKSVSLFDSVSTDRLHVAISAALTGVNVLLYDNSYGKCSGVYHQTLHLLPNVQLKKERKEK